MSANILLCTLGASWAVIPEAYALMAPEILPLYRNHPEMADIAGLRHDFNLEPPGDIWVCTTQGEKTREGIERLREWVKLLPNPPRLHIWQADRTNELATHQECRLMRELIFRVTLMATEQCRQGQLSLSLAGGRKTMSADLQEAGLLFGCQVLIHVVGQEAMPEPLRNNPAPSLMAGPLSADLCPHVLPLAIGSGQRSELLDVAFDGKPPVLAERFPLSAAESEDTTVWPGDGAWLCEEVASRQRAGSRLLGNYLADLSQDERHENWRSLYRLPPKQIEQLRDAPIDQTHREWLIALPKADLHRHVGGCLDLASQIEVGKAIWDATDQYEQKKAIARVHELLHTDKAWPIHWPGLVRGFRPLTPLFAAALLTQCEPAQLERQLYGTTPRVALKLRDLLGFAAYERPGELTGSAVLSHPAAIEPYAHAIVRDAVSEGLAYVELRGSPHKYGDGLTFLETFQAALRQATLAYPAAQQPLFRFVIIANRKDRESTAKVVELAVSAKQRYPDFVVGLDLAGDEGQTSPSELAPAFTAAFEACLPITIHAGEGEPAENIWEAAYHLHADRIGHGLSLSDHPQLAQRFRDRGVCLELCPTSNREVIGFHDPAIPATHGCAPYPLNALWNAGLPLTLCTDNPGISRTTLADEYLAAARMTAGGISSWDALAIVKQGFSHAFLPARQREQLIKQADAAIYAQLTEPREPQ
jgi:adenosine deaminase